MLNRIYLFREETRNPVLQQVWEQPETRHDEESSLKLLSVWRVIMMQGDGVKADNWEL